MNPTAASPCWSNDEECADARSHSPPIPPSTTNSPPSSFSSERELLRAESAVNQTPQWVAATRMHEWNRKNKGLVHVDVGAAPILGPAFFLTRRRRRRTCASSMAVVIAFVCWNLRFMSSSLRMLALPGEEGTTKPLEGSNRSGSDSTRLTEEKKAYPSSPSICLLLSFPNSGTSYTLKNTQLMSGRVVGTNYESESKARRPLFEQGDPSEGRTPAAAAFVGPFIVNATYARADVVLTKTHCSMKADFASFERSCRSVRRVSNGTVRDAEAGAGATYPVELVRGAVHLIRSPLDNVVARMHQGIRKHRGVLPNATLSTFTNDRAGFGNWCRFLDATFGRRIRILLPSSTQAILPSIPCHSDLLHYIGWHNFALEFVRVHNLRYHALHYEDYESDFASTTANLLKFLGLERVGHPAPFVAGKSYRDFYDDDERSAIAELLSRTCAPALWKRLRRYFPDHQSNNGTLALAGGEGEGGARIGAPSFFAATIPL